MGEDLHNVLPEFGGQVAEVGGHGSGREAFRNGPASEVIRPRMGLAIIMAGDSAAAGLKPLGGWLVGLKMFSEVDKRSADTSRTRYQTKDIISGLRGKWPRTNSTRQRNEAMGKLLRPCEAPS